jgi:hypothetical protein
VSARTEGARHILNKDFKRGDGINTGFSAFA